MLYPLGDTKHRLYKPMHSHWIRVRPPSTAHHIFSLTSTVAQHVPSFPIAQSNPTSTEHTASTTTAFPFGAPHPFSQNTPQARPQEHVSRSEECTIHVADAESHFADFKTKVASAGTLSSAERSRLLHQTWISCRPKDNTAWVYNVMVVKHLTGNGWDHTRILSNLKFLDLPPTYAPESLHLMRCLETSGMYLPHAYRVHHRIYAKMVEAAISAGASTSPSQDTELLTLIRLILRGSSHSTRARQNIANDLCTLADKLEARVIKKALRCVLVDTDNTERSILLLLAHAAHKRYSCAVEEILFLLPEKQVRSLVPSITRSLVQAVERKRRLPAETYWHRVRAWMTVLENLDARFNARYPHGTFTHIAFSEVAEHVFKSSNPGTARPLVMLYALVLQMTQQPAYAECRNSLLQYVQANAASMLEQRGTGRMEEDMVKIFSQMRRASLPYEPMINLAAHLFASHAELHSIYRFLHALNKRQLLLDNIIPLQTRIAAELPSLQQQPRAHNIEQREQHAFVLRTCQNILDCLNKVTGPNFSTALVSGQEEIGALQARRAFASILDRALSDHALPQTYAGLTADISLSQRTILIHQLAHSYSLAATRSHRATWRSIYALYNYLESYSLPIGPLFTKAVVRAAIVRPMTEYRFISARRLIWVCQLVARVEGENAAKQIENTFWHRRGDLIKHAKDVHVAAGGDRRVKAMVGRLRQLDMFGSKGD
jgi:hypothetical protein